MTHTRPDKERPLKGVLVGTKTDLPQQRHAVNAKAAQDWAAANNLAFFQVSAAPPGEGLEAPFNYLAETFYKAYEAKRSQYADMCKGY